MRPNKSQSDKRYFSGLTTVFLCCSNHLFLTKPRLIYLDVALGSQKITFLTLCCSSFLLSKNLYRKHKNHGISNHDQQNLAENRFSLAIIYLCVQIDITFHVIFFIPNFPRSTPAPPMVGSMSVSQSFLFSLFNPNEKNYFIYFQIAPSPSEHRGHPW